MSISNNETDLICSGSAKMRCRFLLYCDTMTARSKGEPKNESVTYRLKDML